MSDAPPRFSPKISSLLKQTCDAMKTAHAMCDACAPESPEYRAAETALAALEPLAVGQASLVGQLGQTSDMHVLIEARSPDILRALAPQDVRIKMTPADICDRHSWMTPEIFALALARGADIGGGMQKALQYHGADPAWTEIFLTLARCDDSLMIGGGDWFWLDDTCTRHGDPDLLAQMLEIQVERFPDRMQAFYIQAARRYQTELALLRLFLAGLTPPTCEARTPFHATLASAHGRLGVKGRYGSLRDFMRRAQDAHPEHLRREIAGWPAPS